MIVLFFDRSIGVKIPQELRIDGVSLRVDIEYHDEHFSQESHDDDWLPVIGQRGWIVVGKDRSYHKNMSERLAIIQYKVGCFYLGAANAKTEVLKDLLLRRLDRIIQLSEATERPFIYRVPLGGNIDRVALHEPPGQRAIGAFV